MPLIGWNSKNFGNRPFPNKPRRWNTNKRVKEIKEDGLWPL
jgi:hypothetical protein